MRSEIKLSHQEKRRDAEGCLPGSDLGMQALVVCWMELRLVADRVMIEVGPLFGRRGGGSIGKGLIGGRNTLAKKLREIGVVPSRGLNDSRSPEVLRKEKELKPRTFADVAKKKTGRSWAYHTWLLKGRLNIVVLGRGLLLFEFELLSEAEQVLARGKRRVKKNILFLEKWNPEVGCFCKGAITNEAWARVVGLPLHLWSCEVFKMIGDGCAGFIAMDENTASMVELQWARILVKLVGRDLPSYVQIVVGLGWGVSPFKFGGKPSLGLLRWCHREDVLGWVFQRTKMKLGEVHALCGGSLLENEEGTIKGTEKDVVERSQVNRGQGVEGVDRLGGHNLGPRAFRSGSVHLEAQNNLGPGKVRSGHVLLDA
ncbi:hypothetical protein CK203_002346 [Vitis vinifera]|uniref:DUF4283 domain-containing protein n=1 Tax=Vitis vinifera TaxID=29760 RepID=A0A438KJY6_VITVI|nr:hypothetical protein CK203_002346 [Vitis vinifera]